MCFELACSHLIHCSFPAVWQLQWSGPGLGVEPLLGGTVVSSCAGLGSSPTGSFLCSLRSGSLCLKMLVTLDMQWPLLVIKGGGGGDICIPCSVVALHVSHERLVCLSATLNWFPLGSCPETGQGSSLWSSLSLVSSALMHATSDVVFQFLNNFYSPHCSGWANWYVTPEVSDQLPVINSMVCLLEPVAGSAVASFIVLTHP